MKHLLQLFLLSFLLFAFLPAYAQTPEPCQGDVFFPSDPCADACLFNCFIDGFKGNTGGFTPDTGIVFCGTIETSQWFAFTASAAQTTLTAMPSLCIFGNGVQISVYSDCHGSPIPNGCNGGISGGGNFPVSVTVDLVPGDIYYLMIDGYAGDLCDFTLDVSPSEAVAGYVHTQTIELCAFETIDIQGQPYAAPDTVRIITPAITGCDSVEIYYLKSRETIVTNQTLTFCPGESITLNGSVYSQETTVTQAVSNPAGCDSINIYTLKYTLDPADCPSCSETFMKIIGSAGQQVRGYGVYEAGDGNLYVTGTVQDSALLMKIYPGGGVIWSRSFDIVPGLIDNIAEILEDSDGMIAGAGQAGDLQPGVVGFAFRYDPVSDQMLWVKTFSDESPYVMGILEKEAGGNFIVYSNPHEPVNNAGLTEINRSTGDFTAAPMSVRLDLGAADNFNSALINNGSMYGVGRFTNGSSFTDMRHLLARIDVSNSDITYATLNHVPSGSPARLYGMDLVFDNITKVIYSVAFGDETGENLNNSHVFLHSTYN
ncbi:MAG: hypothetical protein KA165_15480, partial [Saprospiraceae bacterium]|nr:hypothetical protein [Saprospiraceae bacterium]